jgi:ATP phosphoribosyltransferase regulatory subunit HisZ
MSASTDQAERIAEILREIITLWGRKGTDGPHTELANTVATESTHRSENPVLEVRNQKSGLEIIRSVKH